MNIVRACPRRPMRRVRRPIARSTFKLSCMRPGIYIWPSTVGLVEQSWSQRPPRTADWFKTTMVVVGSHGAAAIRVMAAMAARQNRHWHCVPRRGRVGAVFCISTIGAKSPPGPRLKCAAKILKCARAPPPLLRGRLARGVSPAGSRRPPRTRRAGPARRRPRSAAACGGGRARAR